MNVAASLTIMSISSDKINWYLEISVTSICDTKTSVVTAGDKPHVCLLLWLLQSAHN